MAAINVATFIAFDFIINILVIHVLVMLWEIFTGAK